MALFVSVLGTLVTLLCAVLLLRQYRASRFGLLLWSGLCFMAFTISNLLLCLDLAEPGTSSLYLARLSTTLAGLGLLLYGLVWESDRP